MDIPAYVAPSNLHSWSDLDLLIRAEVLINQLHPLPSVFSLALSPEQWRELNPGVQDDIERVAIGFVGATYFPLPYSTAINPTVGEQWETTAISQGWWYTDPPGAATPAQIPPGPQHGVGLGAPNYLVADYLFMTGNWAWIYWA